MRLLLILLLTLNLLNAQKIALLIGNSDYSFSPLKNPTHDVDGIAQTLREIGFKRSDIKILKNASKTQMESALANFSQKAQSAEIALIYFSGHGMQVNNTNYMFPARTTATKPIHLRTLVDLNYFIESATSAKYGIILIDACRDNPLVKYFNNGKKGSVHKGLGQVEPTVGQMVIGFATSAGDTADDGNGNMSPYATALANRLKEKDDIRNILGKVGNDVSKKYEQNPVYKANLDSNICLTGKCYSGLDMGLALIHISINGDINEVHKYLNNGININYQNKYGETALMYASDRGHINIVELLIKKGANVNIQNRSGATALIWASESGKFNIVKMLIKSGAKINIVDNQASATALGFASYNGHVNIVKLLIESGAKTDLLSASSALVLATVNNHTKIIHLLIEAGADINNIDIAGTTPLIAAASNGNLNLVKLFIRLGANINIRTKKHKASAIMYAAQGDNYLDVVEYLVSKGANTSYRWSNYSRNETVLERAKRKLKEMPNGKYDRLVEILSKK